jgi:hypothetical protein
MLLDYVVFTDPVLISVNHHNERQLAVLEEASLKMAAEHLPETHCVYYRGILSAETRHKVNALLPVPSCAILCLPVPSCRTFVESTQIQNTKIYISASQL